MDKFFHSRFFRFLVSFVLVCAILINCSPLRAEASAIGATVVTGTAAAGILGLLFSMAMGVVFADITAEMVSGIGQSVIDSVTNKYANDTETSNTVKEYFDNLSYSFGGSGDDGTGNGDGKIHILDGVILAGLVAWVKSLIENDSVDVGDGTAPERYMYYNGVLLPEYTGSYQYQLIFQDSNSKYYFIGCPVAWEYINVNDSGNYAFRASAYGKGVLSEVSGDSWSGSNYTFSTNNIWYQKSYSLVWANHDILYYDTGDLYLSGTKPTSVLTTTFEPSVYVGDIPSQVKDDSFDEEKYRLPYIDYSKILPGLNDYVTELNNLAQQMANNTKTYEEYMKDIQTENKPESDPDPSEPSDPEETKPEEDEEDEEEEKELDMFTLDLSDYFPFCIPFDLYDFFTCLNADPVAPVIEWFVPLPGGGKYPLRIDLSAYDDVAQLLRRLQLLLFCVGLAFKTRDLIKG